MSRQARRERLIRILEESQQPLTGAQLSDELHVTRQVIVADIAILRASGIEIMATPRGYMLQESAAPLYQKTIASKHHSDPEAIRQELYLIVDLGGEILDVKVEHPLYGELTASLQIRSRLHVDQFIKSLAESKAEPLLVLTDGLHLHTIAAESPDVLEQIAESLAAHGFLPEE